MASTADDTIHKQSFSIDDLATRSVTLYPTRAAVVRDIENVTIKVSASIYPSKPHRQSIGPSITS